MEGQAPEKFGSYQLETAFSVRAPKPVVILLGR
jgi:hypothetical protein